jgi:CheY-like chemotaxis protein
MTNRAKRQIPIILMVESSVLARLVLCDYLRECKYRVFEASNSVEALDVLNNCGLQIDIVLSELELELPGQIDGFGLAQTIRQRWPQTKVLLTGTISRAADLAADLCKEGPLLAKPYDKQLVVDHIKRLRAGLRGESCPGETRAQKQAASGQAAMSTTTAPVNRTHHPLFPDRSGSAQSEPA